MNALWVSAGLALTAIVTGGCQDLDIKPGAKSIFAFMAPPSPQEAAKMSVDPYDADQRYRGTLMLANAPFAGERVYVQLFTDNANDPDPGVRAAAIRGLGAHGTSEQADLLTGKLKDPEAQVRMEAARALQRIYAPASIDPLIALIDPVAETNPDVRVEAIRALGQYPEKRVVEKLIAALSDDSLACTRTTQWALRMLTGQDFGTDRASWAAWYKTASDPFAARGEYMYPVYARGRKWYEYLPFMPPPPNEPSATPAGTPVAQ